MAIYNDNNNDYTSKGVGNAGLTLGIIGTALASGVLNGNGLGNLFGQRQDSNPAASNIYQLSQKDVRIAQLEAERYSDAEAKIINLELSNLKQRVTAIEVAEPLREQILREQINCVANTVNRLVQPMIPNGNIAPGWGPAFVSPFPPPPPVYPPVNNGGTTTTPTSTTAQAA